MCYNISIRCIVIGAKEADDEQGVVLLAVTLRHYCLISRQKMAEYVYLESNHRVPILLIVQMVYKTP